MNIRPKLNILNFQLIPETQIKFGGGEGGGGGNIEFSIIMSANRHYKSSGPT